MINENVFWVVEQDSRFAVWARDARIRMVRLLESLVDFDSIEHALDVGVTAERDRQETNVFEMLYPHKDRVTAISPQDASWIEEEWPGMTFVSGDGREMPFEDGQFDLVVSFAVLEHVGSLENQQKFLAECYRVAKKYVFISTPNAWYPVELHTAIPLIHWLPKPIYRKILKCLRFGFFADENNLNLLTRRKIRRLCRELGIPQYALHHIRFFGLKSNLLLFIDKRESTSDG